MARLLRLTTAAALAAAALVPTAASAYTCRPYLEDHTYDVAGHQVEAYDVGMVC
jgi:hypothetical protein